MKRLRNIAVIVAAIIVTGQAAHAGTVGFQTVSAPVPGDTKLAALRQWGANSVPPHART